MVQSKSGCDSLTDAFKAKESKLHILINNSGATWGAPFNAVPEKEGWDKIMALNVKGVFYSTWDFMPNHARPKQLYSDCQVRFQHIPHVYGNTHCMF